MKKIKIGDIVEIKTEHGFVYAQVTHRHKTHGMLLRLIDGVFKERPGDLNALVARKTKFSVFFPLAAAVSRGRVWIAGNASVPRFATDFPMFRNGVPNPNTGKVEVWWLWDGEKEWKIGELTEQQRKLPIAEVLNYTLLVRRLESDWMPEDES